ncbi:MAG: type II toxin-antitoxin system PemK/MazF family toxin [Planctomycetota bacterium]|nr:type II toxin-antitoxin system PemK/MazF family toxin [Planctomycetota bacterium]
MPRVTCPSRGDIVWLDFDPQVGHEQAGRRSAVVLSHREYNLKTGLAIVCPMTSKVDKGWPFTVKVAEDSGVIADQVKCIDWRGRRAEIKGRLHDATLQQVITTFARLILPISQ